MDKVSRNGILLVSAAALLFLALTIPLAGNAYYHDEVYNMQTMHSHDLAKWAAFWLQQLHIHPPLVSMLYYLWTSVAGETEFALRVPSILAGLLTIYLTYFVGRRLFGDRVGIAATFMVAVSSAYIRFAVAGVHAIFEATVTMLSILAFLRYCENPSRRHLRLLLLANLIGFATFYYYVFLAAFQGLYLLLNRKKYQVPVYFLASLVAMALLCGAAIFLGYEQTYEYTWWGRGSIEYAMAIMSHLPFGSSGWLDSSFLPAAVEYGLLAAIGAGLLLPLWARIASAEKTYLPIAMFLPPIVVFIVGGIFDMPIARERTFFHLLPLYSILVGSVIARITVKPQVLGLTVALILVPTLYASNRAIQSLYRSDYLRHLVTLPEAQQDAVVYIPDQPLPWFAYSTQRGIKSIRYSPSRSNPGERLAKKLGEANPKYVIAVQPLDIGGILRTYNVNLALEGKKTVGIEVPDWFNYATQTVSVYIYTLKKEAAVIGAESLKMSGG